VSGPSAGHDANADTGEAFDPLARSVSPYTTREKIGRVLWNLVGQVLFRWTFHNWYGVRRGLLRLFGATIGHHVRLRPSVIIEQPWNLTIGDNSSIGDRAIVYCLGKVTLGNNVSLSQMVHLCAGTHDYTKSDLPLIRPSIVIEDEVWLAADVFIAPGVRVGRGTVVGARSSVFKDLPPWKVCAGSPAKPLKDRILSPN
jgi:putative colanic acid biosynthesis acetyltransferase WcaF